MLNEQELKIFLDLLRAFGLATRLSNRSLADLFGIGHVTLNRWVRNGADGNTGTTIYRSFAEPVRHSIEKLNKLDASTGLYAAIKQEKRAERMHILRSELDKRT